MNLHRFIATEAHAVAEVEADLTTAKGLAELLGTDSEQAQLVLQFLEGLEQYGVTDASQEALEAIIAETPDQGLESLSATAQRLWAALVSYLRRIRDWIRKNVSTMRLSLSSMALSEETLRARSKAYFATAPRDRVGQPLALGDLNATLAIFYRPPKDVGQIVLGLNVVHDLLQNYHHYKHRIVLPELKTLQSLLNSVRHDTDLTEHLARIDQVLEKASPVRVRRMFSQNNLENNVYVGQHLPYNHRLVLESSTHRFEGAENLPHVSLVLRRSEIRPRSIDIANTIPRFNLQANTQLLDAVQRVTQSLQAIHADNYVNAYERVLKDLIQAAEGAQSRLERGEGDGSAVGAWVKMVEVSLRALTRWTTVPERSVVVLAMRVNRAALAVARMNQSS